MGVADSVIKLGRDIYDKVYDVAVSTHRKNVEIDKYKDKRYEYVFKAQNLSKHQEREIKELFINNYGKNIPYTWHHYYTAFSGKFDVNYFPEYLYMSELERYMNQYDSYVDVFADKNMMPIFASYAKIQTPKMIISAVKGMLKDEENNVIRKDQALSILYDVGSVFIKPTVDSCSGKGCSMLNIKGGVDTESGLTVEKIIDNYGYDFVVQECVTCHDKIRDIYPFSVNTFRIITYRWKNEIVLCPSVMRLGRSGNYLDNAHAGGIFIAIGDNGELHKYAYSEFGDRYEEHPDTHVVFAGYSIPRFRAVLDAAITMHSLIPQIGIIHWDFTIDSNSNPVLIEANTMGGVFGFVKWHTEKELLVVTQKTSLTGCA